MGSTWIRRIVRVAIVVVALIAVSLGGYSGLRAYASANADTVNVLAQGGIPSGQTLPAVRLTYHGATARRMQAILNDAPQPQVQSSGPFGPFHNVTCNALSESPHYGYALTFWARGVMVETAKLLYGGCIWGLSTLGWSDGRIDQQYAIIRALYLATNGQLPVMQELSY